MKPLKALISKNTIHRAHVYKALEPGDDLQDYDIVVVGVECHTDASTNEVEYGVYRKNNEYIYYFESRLRWDLLKDEYQWTYNNAYTHYILKVYRPCPGKKNTINPRKGNIDIKDLENSQDYYCIYSNPVLLKKFKLK